jgi:hypothetical protein
MSMCCLIILPATKPSPILTLSLRCSVSRVSELRRTINQQNREELKSSAETTTISIEKLDRSCHNGVCFLGLWEPMGTLRCYERQNNRLVHMALLT